MLSAVHLTLAQLALQPADQGAMTLAKLYAEEIDKGEDLAVYGPKLLACLAELGATPKARKAMLAKGSAQGYEQRTGNPLDELRERRRARENRSASVDASTS